MSSTKGSTKRRMFALRAVVYHEVGKYTIERDKPVPVPAEGQVLIKVKACGVCATDVHLHHGNFLAAYPFTPGHELAGAIEAVGPGVTDFRVGDRVCTDPVETCGTCYYCKRNQPLYCERFVSYGCNRDGGFAEYVVADQSRVFSIHDLTWDQAVLVEPTACAVHGLEVIQIRPGDKVLMFGTGPSGIILAQLLKHAGAGELVVVGSSQRKLDVVEKLTDATTVAMDRDDYSKHTERLKRIAPRGFDVVVDVTGAPKVIEHAVSFAARGGKLVIYGVAPNDSRIQLNPYDIFINELKVLGSFAEYRRFDQAIEFIRKGVVKGGFITHRYRIDQWGEALEQVERGRDRIKVVVEPERTE